MLWVGTRGVRCGPFTKRVGGFDIMREEADVLNAVWDWARRRAEMSGHPYYFTLAQDMMAFVRSYGRKQ